VTARVVFLGNDGVSVPPLEALAADPEVDVVLVLTRDPRPGRRGAGPVPTPVATAARRLSVPVREVPTVVRGDGLSALRAAAPDVLAVVAYGELLPAEVLDVATHGAVNLHLSLLPRWRGASPVQHALLAGDPETGVTAMQIDAGLDTGAILDRASTAIDPREDAGGLADRLSRVGGPLLARAVRDLLAGRASPRPQNDDLATFAPKLTADDRRLRWDGAAPDLVRRVRAFAPRPGADTLRAGRTLKVLSASEGSHGPGADPGTVVAIDPSWFEVAAGEGRVRVHEVAAEGRARMDAGAWLHGARLAPGERLG
jgi:methionyl-tRNA formyltransferase